MKYAKKYSYNTISTIIIIIIIFLFICIVYNLYNIKLKNNIFENFKEYKYKVNEIKRAIEYNEPIEEKLNVIVVISNPCLYNRRYKLLKYFTERIEKEEKDVNLYIVELIYNNQKFAVTDKNNPSHLQIKTETPLWHKENMINLGVKYLLPKNYKAFAWIDADIEFENRSWALDTLKILNGTKDVVQIFSHCALLDQSTNISIINSGFGYDYVKYNKYKLSDKVNWKPGFGWAITRKAYEKIGGLYDKAIIGGGDSIMAFSLINRLDIVKNEQFKVNNEYIDIYIHALKFQHNCSGLKLGYVPGVIRHYFHGTRENRKYLTRHEILQKNKYSYKYLQYDKLGILEPSQHFPEELKKDIFKYFQERKEDD